MSCQRPFSRLVASENPAPPDRFCCFPVSGFAEAEGQLPGPSVGMDDPLFSRGSRRKRNSRFQASGLDVPLLSRSTRTSYWPLSWQVELDSLMVRETYAAIGRAYSPAPKFARCELHGVSSVSRRLTLMPSP
ncbi:hypothetical protein [Streptomyces anulatus]|uniref:hypothetical protein n=1 Tax=Streptomyces anulatus TaxID=1892 RepID=UPI003D81AF5E